MATAQTTSHNFFMAQDEAENFSRAMGLFVMLLYRAYATDASDVDILEIPLRPATVQDCSLCIGSHVSPREH